MKSKYLISLLVLHILTACSENYKITKAAELKKIDTRASVVSLVTSEKNAISITNGGRFVYALYDSKIKIHNILYHGVREAPINSDDYEFITEKINQIKYNSRKNQLDYYTTIADDPPGIKYYVKIRHYGKVGAEILNCDTGHNKIIFNTVRNRLCDKMQNENNEMGACFLWKHDETFPRKQE